MTAPLSSGMDFPLWCGKLSAALQLLLEGEADPNRRTIARLTLNEYDAEIARRQTASRQTASNMVPIRPFSIHDAIDKVMPR